jgi:hypothetical protein
MVTRPGRIRLFLLTHAHETKKPEIISTWLRSSKALVTNYVRLTLAVMPNIGLEALLLSKTTGIDTSLKGQGSRRRDSNMQEDGGTRRNYGCC